MGLQRFRIASSGMDATAAIGKTAYFGENSRSRTKCCGREFFIEKYGETEKKIWFRFPKKAVFLLEKWREVVYSGITNKF